MARPIGSFDKKKRKSKEQVNSLAFNLKSMKIGDYLYTRAQDKSVSGVISMNGLSGKFKTERVIVFHAHSHKVEEGVMVTKITD